jgi:hypothetical protein
MNETVTQGKYYIGDPISVLPDKYSIGIWGNEYDYQNGKFNINGFEMIVHRTHSGDGVYKDTRDRIYKISSGTIGLIPIELLSEQYISGKGCHIFEFLDNINFIYDAGLIYIKSGKKFISIDTRNMEEYDSDYETHYENENGEPITKTIQGDSDDDLIEECDTKSESDNEDLEEDPNNMFEPKPIQHQSFFKKR